MTYDRFCVEELGAEIQISCFAPTCGVKEWHAMLHIDPRGEMFPEQYHRLQEAEMFLLQKQELKDAKIVFKRYFLSDSTNQQPLMQETGGCRCTTSYIQQSPLDGSKVALWMYLQQGTEVRHEADESASTVVSHNGYKHIWTMGLVDEHDDSMSQTQHLLQHYESLLADHGTNIAEGCIRTWFFVRDVDTQYHGLVVARRQYFDSIGLNEHTHYISSTGIGGNPSDTKSLVQLGAYAMTGFAPEQQRYLYAPTHLNRTSEYGVTFERGTLLAYGDRKHAYISGTASIDNKGQVVHVGDVRRQTLRMWENVECLLQEAGMGMKHLAQIIVYLRDIADYETVRAMFAEHYPDVPTVITLAPVCRPTWLIEMECIAVCADNNPEFPGL